MVNRSTAALPKVELELCEIPEQTVLKSKAEIDERFDIRTKCFSNGIARGTKDDILSMLKAYHHEDAKILSTEIPGIFEVDMRYFFPYHDGEIYLLDMINRFPTLKIAGFLETDWEVYIALSDSGYAGITDMEFAGGWDPKSEDSWQWNYSPTEDIAEAFRTIQTSSTMMVAYVFPYEEDWHDRNYYVVKDGKSYRLKFENRTMALPWDSPKLWTLKHSKQYANTAYIVRYLGNEPDVIFPEKIGDINIVGVADREEETPKNYKKIRSVQIPKTYESIGKNAFRGCIALKEVLFCDGKYPYDRLRRIDDRAFADCSALEEIQLPKLRDKNCRYADDLESLGDGVFENCRNLRDVWVINPGINASADNTFKNCENYIIHGKADRRFAQAAQKLAQANPGHYKPITAEECRELFATKH